MYVFARPFTRVDRQMFTHEIDIMFKVLLDFFDGDRMVRTTGHTRGKFFRTPHAIIAARIKIRKKVVVYHAEGACDTARFAAGAAHLIAFQVAVERALKGIVITSVYARRIVAVTADRRERRVFTQTRDAVVLRVVKIIARKAARLARVAYV